MKKKKNREKRGKPFERLVKEVLSMFEPAAIVRHGPWVEGPDGRRELDVYIEGTVDGIPRRTLVECKDFNPKTTGPVGIGLVDALESKRRDVGVDASFICSNAGFTTEARRKAKRVGIGLIAVLRARDPRIRYQVQEDLYYRKLKVELLEMGFSSPSPVDPAKVPLDQVMFKGLPVQNWILGRVWALLHSNPITDGAFQKSHRLRSPVEFTAPNGSVIATYLSYRFLVSGSWFEQEVTLDATTAVYDWLRRRVRLLPGLGQSFLIGPFRSDTGRPVAQPPDPELEFPPETRPGESWLQLVQVEGLGLSEPSPPLDDLVVAEDLNVRPTEWIENQPGNSSSLLTG